jgi:hypothetical protein
MRGFVALSMIGLFAASASAAPAPEDSWGKPGVTFLQYRQDAAECAVEGYLLDISHTQDAQDFVRATKELESVPGGMVIQSTAITPTSNSVDVVTWANIQQHIIESIRPEERFKAIKALQLAKTDSCLVQRGYSKFRLTDDQRHQLRHLKFGSNQRRAYLYSLASNPAVLAAQREQ